MSILGFDLNRSFRLRSSQRDRDNDVARAAKLVAFLEDLRAEIEKEKSGLSNRFERTQDSAAFSLQALENDPSGSLSRVVDGLTEKTVRYGARLDVLSSQIDLLTALCRQAEQFPLNAANEEPSQQVAKLEAG